MMRSRSVGLGLGALVVASAMFAQAADPVVAPSLFTKEEPWKFFLTLFFLATLAGGGKVAMMWTVTRPFPHQIGQLMLSITAAMVVAFYGWNRWDLTDTMAAAICAAPMFDIVFDLVFRQLWGRAGAWAQPPLLPVPPPPPPTTRREGDA